jgi:hypothetical protein
VVVVFQLGARDTMLQRACCSVSLPGPHPRALLTVFGPCLRAAVVVDFAGEALMQRLILEVKAAPEQPNEKDIMSLSDSD